MISYLGESKLVWIGRLLTGYNLKFKGSNRIIVLSENFENVRFKLLENDRYSRELKQVFVHREKRISSCVIWIPFKWPIFTVLLSISQIIFFQLLKYDIFEESFSTNLCFDEGQGFEIWRFWTPVFIHYSSTHLWENLTVQIWTSTCLEICYGWKPTLVLYFSSAFFANFAISIYGPFQQSCGCSGAVFGLIGAHLAALIKNWNLVWLARWRCCFIVIYLLYCILIGWLSENSKTQQPIITGHSAHFGGAIGGFLIGCLVLENFGGKPDN